MHLNVSRLDDKKLYRRDTAYRSYGRKDTTRAAYIFHPGSSWRKYCYCPILFAFYGVDAFFPDRATEDKMHICRPVICRVTDMLPLPHLMHSKNAQHTILHLNIKPRTNPQVWTSNSAPRFSAFHNFLLLLSFSPIKQSFQLASKRCAALGWGPSKPPVCRQVFRHRESVLFFKDLAHK